jgi:hypothetical protein
MSTADRAWAEAVFERFMPERTRSRWTWSGRESRDRVDGPSLVIKPVDGYIDDGVWAMLNDIQRVTRRMMDHQIIQATGKARARALDRIGRSAPTGARFREVARIELALAGTP